MMMWFKLNKQQEPLPVQVSTNSFSRVCGFVYRYRSLILALGFISYQPAYALISDQKQPITLEADHATYNEKTGVTTYNGNVIVTQGTIRIAGDTFTANLDPNRAIINANATGNPVKFQQQLENIKGISKGEGKNLVYDAQNGIVILTGDAWLNHNGATFKGDTLRYSMNVGDIEATGSTQRRVKLVIPPNLSPKKASAKTR